MICCEEGFCHLRFFCGLFGKSHLGQQPVFLRSLKNRKERHWAILHLLDALTLQTNSFLKQMNSLGAHLTWTRWVRSMTAGCPVQQEMQQCSCEIGGLESRTSWKSGMFITTIWPSPNTNFVTNLWLPSCIWPRIQIPGRVGSPWSGSHVPATCAPSRGRLER